MLFLAKAEHGLVAPGTAEVPLRGLCQRLVEYYGMLAENLSLELSGDEVGVQGDQLMLERAIGNLLVNAIHHTPAAGRITLEIASQPEFASITVTNSGPPIPADAIGTIFDRFVRLSPDHEGSGLGLAIARSIVVAHGGSIAVHARNQATQFVITIPIHTAS